MTSAKPEEERLVFCVQVENLSTDDKEANIIQAKLMEACQKGNNLVSIDPQSRKDEHSLGQWFFDEKRRTASRDTLALFNIKSEDCKWYPLTHVYSHDTKGTMEEFDPWMTIRLPGNR